MSGFFLGSVVPTSVVCARYGSAASEDLPQGWRQVCDCDVTTGYVETCSQHLAHSIQFGISVHLVLWGSSNWSSLLASQTITNLAERYVANCRATQAQASSVFSENVLIASSGTFDAANQRFSSSVNTAQLRPADHPALLQRVTAHVGGQYSPSSITWLRLSTLIGDCECSATFFVLPPFGGECSMDVHLLLRNTANDFLLTANALTMFVVHVGPEPVDSAAVETLGVQRSRLCAPVPNTKAARYLISKLQADGGGVVGNQHSNGSATSGGDRHDAQDVMLELRALEAEHVSLRAAYMELAAKNSPSNRQPTRDTSQQGRNADDRVLSVALTHVTKDQQQSALSSLVSSVHDLHVSLRAIEENVRTMQTQATFEPDRTLRALLAWRQEESDTLLRLIQQGSSGGLMSSRSVEPSNIVSPRAGTTIGPSLGSDPLTSYYRNRVDELEAQLVQLADVDVEGTVAEYYCTEVARLEREVVDWMTKYELKVKIGP